MRLVTTSGDLEAGAVRAMLPHEHVFTDIRTGSPPGFAQGQADAVIRLVAPALQQLKSIGIDVLVEATPVGVGRRADILQAVTEATGFPLVVPTGIYREPWVPQWAHEASQAELQQWMERELHEGIEGTRVRAGWIKLSAGDDALTPVEEKILRAAVRAAKTCGAVIGSHTVRGSVINRQADILEAEGYDPARLIWIHTQAEQDRSWHDRLARRGVWLEYDNIGSGHDEQILDLVQHGLDAGYDKQILISQDRGWYDPADPSGSRFKDYAWLSGQFIPMLQQRGLGQAVDRLIRINPFQAFAR